MKTVSISSFIFLLLFCAKAYPQVGITHYHPDVISVSYSPFTINQSAIGGEIKNFCQPGNKRYPTGVRCFLPFHPQGISQIFSRDRL